MGLFKNMSIRNKIIAVIALAVILSTFTVGVMVQQDSKAIVRHRLLEVELPSILDKFSLDIDHQVELLLAASQQFANNQFVEAVFHDGQVSASDQTHLVAQLQRLRQQYGLSDATIASRQSANFWNQDGFLRQLNHQQDSWFFDFIHSDKPTMVSMFQEANGTVKMFADYQQVDGKLMTSVGKSMSEMVALLNRFTIEKTGYVYLINAKGEIQIGRPAIKSSKSIQALYADKASTLLNKDSFNLIKTTIDGKSLFVASHYVPSMNWFVVGVVPEQEIFADIHQITMQIMITTLVVVLIFIGLAFVLANGIANPIKNIAQRFRDLGNGGGDLSQRLDVQGQDEIALLSEGFNAFVAQIQQSIMAVAQTSQTLQQEAESVSLKSAITHDNSQNQHEQSLSIVTAMNQMGATISEIASNAATASDTAKQASLHTEQGREVINQTKDVIHHLAQSMSNAVTQVQQLASTTRDIGSILDVIQGVSDQTNLLALNAAIEAARAGEHGRGFAVVADEVRNLAKRTTESAAQIQTMISKLQADSQQAVDAMQTGQQLSEKGENTTEQAVAVLDDIYRFIQDMSDVNSQVATATEEQATTVGSINQNIESMSELNTKTTHTAEELAQASQELHELSDRLNKLVGQFNL
ncbi:methyl-accepting chemotaxis protein [Celerinatantimonas yamalensis]|uniref:Methyl-accepting chemotaxis protein n=1 Tax=Celerinatantimonas yamalensis TaxID=559956 RepID=A0ABW9G4M4_9GAMM